MSLKSHGNALPEGYRLHWYRIGRVLGQGGFGITYEAFDTNLETPVAIKEYLPKEFAVREQDSTVRPFTEDRKKMFEWGLERFLQEARNLAKFHHQNIVRVYNVFEENGTAYMVMEFEQGEALDRLFKFGRIESEADLLRITFPLLDGLEHMHQAGFIHRDIKPANIYVRLDGSPVLIDFGSARFAIGGETKTLTSLITPGFAPYEQYHTESGKQGAWTDIYSLGATLYAGINRGRSPLDAIVRGNARIEGKSDSMEPAVELGKGKYTSDFLQAVDAALGFTPTERPQTVTEWRALFPSLDKQPPTPEIKSQSQEDITTVIHKKVQLSTGPRRGLVKWLVISLVVVVIASGIYFIETRQPSKAPAPDQLEAIDVQRQQREQEAERLALEAQRKQEEQARLAQEAKVRKQQEEQERIDQLKRKREQQAEAQRKQEEQARLAQEAKVRKQQEEQERIDQLMREEERKKQVEIITQKKREKEKRDQQINLLLAKGKAAISAQRLSKPVGDNALEYFQRVFQIDSNNLDAQQGVRDVIKGYISLAEKASGRNLFDKAEAYLTTAKAIDPENELLNTAIQSVNEQKLARIQAKKEGEKLQRLQEVTDETNEQIKTKTETKKHEAIQKKIGLVVLASGRNVGYGPSGLAGEDVRNNLVNTLHPVIPKDKYSILHSEWVSLNWYIKETRHEGYRVLCNKYNANQILLSIIDGADTEITISFYNCQNQEEIVERSFSLPSAIESKLMKFIKKHQLFQ
jgi:serine/threonine protein kinase